MKWTVFDEIRRYFRYRNVLKEIPNNSVICDYGCKDGGLLYTLSPKIRKGYGCDLRIKSRNEGNLEFKQIDLIENIPKIDVDRLCMIGFVEHFSVENTKKILKNGAKIIKANGKLLITTPSKYSKFILELMAKLKLIDGDEIFDHKHYFTKSELAKLLKRVGYKKVNIRYFEFGMNIFAIAEK